MRQKKHHADANHEKCAINTIVAQSYQNFVNENQKEEVKHHSLTLSDLI